MAEVSTEAAASALLALTTSILNTLVERKVLTSEDVGDIILSAGESLRKGGNAEAINVLNTLIGGRNDGGGA